MKRLATDLLIAFTAATCISGESLAAPPEHHRGSGESYSVHQHRPYYYRRYYYAPPDRGHQPFHPHH